MDCAITQSDSNASYPGCFVVGTGRCGSTFLSQALAEHPQILSLSEFFTVLGGPHALVPDALDGTEVWEQMTTPQLDMATLLAHGVELPEVIGARTESAALRARLAPLLLVPLPQLGDQAEALWGDLREFTLRLPRSPLPNQYAALFDWLQARLRRDIWVERSGASLDYVATLARHWPQAKFVHLAREGTACARSMSKHAFFRVKLARLLRRDPRLPVMGCLAMDLPLARFGAMWSAQILAGERELSRLPAQQVFRVRFESILREPRRALGDILHFLDPALRVERAWLERVIAKIRSVPKPDVDATPCALQELCRPGMRAIAATFHDGGTDAHTCDIAP